jgi:hypothetical protein
MDRGYYKKATAALSSGASAAVALTTDVHSAPPCILIGGAGCYEDIFIVEHLCPAHVGLGLVPDSGESLRLNPRSPLSHL